MQVFEQELPASEPFWPVPREAELLLLEAGLAFLLLCLDCEEATELVEESSRG